MRIESWLYWILIDTTLVWLYWVQALRGIAVLYVVSLIVSLFGLASWLKQYRSSVSTP
jgi:nicotinamide riboside transporter PnuC